MARTANYPGSGVYHVDELPCGHQDGRCRAPGKRPSRLETLESVLRAMHMLAEERPGTEADHVRRRLILRGFRAGAWAMADKPDIDEVRALLYDELFGGAR